MAKKPKNGADEIVESMDDSADDSMDTRKAGDEAATDAVFAEDEFTAAADTTPRSSRLPAVIATGAFIISVLTAAGFFYLASTSGGDDGKQVATDANIAALTKSIARTDASLSELQASVASIDGRSSVSGTDIAALEQRLENRLRSMEAVPGQIIRLERSFAALQGISTGVQDTWLLAEAEYYMQIANAQLQLAGNPHLATLALRLADERLLQLADPALTDVRRVLSNELQALEITEKPDIEGATMTLASLASLVDSLPLRQEVETYRLEDEVPDPELTGVDRALASLKGAIGDVVTVRRTDEATRPLIAPEAVYFLRANLALQLQAARLSLLRGEQALFRQSLDDATVWIEEYYDRESTPVLSALLTIREIRDTSFVTSLPDISESLHLLRQHVSFTQATMGEDALQGATPDDTAGGETSTVLSTDTTAEPAQ
jgi:uroporphyrin-3 C-methyltransferase